MSTQHDVQLNFAVAIGIWARLVIAAVTSATWRGRAGISPSTKAAL